MFHYSALSALVMMLILWAALIFDYGNTLHHLSETMHFIEHWVKKVGVEASR